MSRSERHDDSRTSRGSSDTSDADSVEDGATEWFAASTLRVGLVLVGLVLLLFALGQAVGVDLLGLVGDALGSRVGRWLVVAFFALVLIVVGLRGFGSRAN